MASFPPSIQLCEMGTIMDISYSRWPTIICAHRDIRIVLSICTTLSDWLTKFTPWTVSEQASPLRNDLVSPKGLIKCPSLFLPTVGPQTLWCSFHPRPPSYDSPLLIASMAAFLGRKESWTLFPFPSDLHPPISSSRLLTILPWCVWNRPFVQFNILPPTPTCSRTLTHRHSHKHSNTYTPHNFGCLFCFIVD